MDWAHLKKYELENIELNNTIVKYSLKINKEIQTDETITLFETNNIKINFNNKSTKEIEIISNDISYSQVFILNTFLELNKL